MTIIWKFASYNLQKKSIRIIVNTQYVSYFKIYFLSIETMYKGIRIFCGIW